MPRVTGIGALADNYIWAATPENARVTAIVDPGEATPVRSFLDAQGLSLGAILITHHHPDHTAGVAELAAGGVPVYGPAEAQRAAPLTTVVAQGDRVALDWLGITFETIAVPGHTAGHIAYYGAGAHGGLLFSGDTLFRGGCGRLFEGDATQMRASLAKLRALPADTAVYCGHEYTLKNLQFAAAVEPDNAELGAALRAAEEASKSKRCTLPSSIGDERAINPFMRWDAPEVIAAAERRAGGALAGSDAVFASIRQWKDNF